MKDVVTEARMAAGVISRRMVNKIGMRVVKANYPSKLKEYGGPWPGVHLKLTVYSRKKLLFKESIIEEHEISKELLLSLDRTPLSHASPVK